MRATPEASHDDGDGRTEPDEHLIRAGYTLGRDDGCIADARQHALAFLDQAEADYLLSVSARTRDLTQLVISELVTNACKHVPGPVLVELRINTRAVDVVVWDSDPTVPAARAADPDRIGQHGLEIVKAITDELFVEQEPVGKRITARASPCTTPRRYHHRRRLTDCSPPPGTARCVPVALPAGRDPDGPRRIGPWFGRSSRELAARQAALCKALRGVDCSLSSSFAFCASPSGCTAPCLSTGTGAGRLPVCDCSGLGVLLGVRALALAAGGSLCVIGPLRPLVARVVQVTKLDSVLLADAA
ncbi:anti-sigma regulatory factor (Ser/Thr protein kinase) [Streptomyces rishiriensis]|uniref:Anti-sigma regulatory factor (Ser/Thr protein kinase) n=1 Tax=Streptomyces rishiriensis TaxID=68264 RepID=A0ABU0NFT7_STRRH|nr:anti-sigma regulatory factor (Ser/Thr protein kinase) [Streptomyces rishiriensis]